MTRYFMLWLSRNSLSFWMGMAGLLCRDADHTSTRQPWRGGSCSYVFWAYDCVSQKDGAMSASKVLALTTLFLATMFAETEWKEFISSEGNFRVVFPETPQEQKGTERNLHRFSAVAGDESYGLTYADYGPGTDWESVVNGERDSIVKGFGGSVVDERRTSVEGYPGKWIRFFARNTSGEVAIYFTAHLLRVLHASGPKSTPRPENFSTFLNSFLLLSRPKA